MVLLKSYGFIFFLISELRLSSSSNTTSWCDNLGATFLSANSVFHAHTKHVEVDYHFIHDNVAKKEIQVQFISSKDQLVDILTKPLPLVSFASFQSKLRVVSTLSLTRHIMERVLYIYVNILYRNSYHV